MTNFTDYTEGKICDLLLGTAWTPPTGLHVALFNGSPTDAASGGTDVTSTIRTAGRVQGTFVKSSVAGLNKITNSVAIDFGAAAGAATVSHFAVYDAATAGNMLWHGALTGGSMSVGAGTTVSFAINTLELEIQ